MGQCWLTDRDFDPHGPAGPTAFWKISDQIDKEHEDADVEAELWEEGASSDEAWGLQMPFGSEAVFMEDCWRHMV